MSQVNMYWYSGSAWKETDELYTYNSGSWKRVMECYIYDGSWRLTHYADGSLNSLTVTDTSIGCDPTLGNFSAAWTYTVPSGFEGMWEIDLDYSFDGGSNWNLFSANQALTSSPIAGSLDGIPGFTSLDNTNFRLRMELVSNNAISGSSSPRTASPPYAC